MVDAVLAAGGMPMRVMPLGPSYLHGWSPDGARLAFVATPSRSEHYRTGDDRQRWLDG
jgi:hypothetical protein